MVGQHTRVTVGGGCTWPLLDQLKWTNAFFCEEVGMERAVGGKGGGEGIREEGARERAGGRAGGHAGGWVEVQLELEGRPECIRSWNAGQGAAEARGQAREQLGSEREQELNWSRREKLSSA